MLYRFTGGADGARPRAGVVLDQEGNVYGTTTMAGDLNCYSPGVGCGTVFQLTHSGSSWTYNVLYTFHEGDGSPSGGVIFDQAGNLYGTSGMVYSLMPSGGTWIYSVIYAQGGGGDLGIDAAGNLYSAGGGPYGAGSIFKLTPSNGSWTFGLLYDFTGLTDGNVPVGGFILEYQGQPVRDYL